MTKFKTSRSFSEDFNVADHAVSGETFTLKKHPDLEMWMTTPLPENLQKYYESKTYLSHKDRGTTLFEKAYQWVKAARTRRKLSWLKRRVGTPGRLLDIGTGTGEFLKAAQRSGWKVRGVELNATARDLAQKKGLQVAQSLEEIKEANYDVITLWHVLEHLPDLEASIKKINALIKPNGILVLALPNFKSWDAQHYGSYWAGYDVPRHLWHFSKMAITELFESNSWAVEKIRPMHMDAFYVALLSEKYRHGSMRWGAAFINGMLSNLKAYRTGEYSSLVYVLKMRKKDV